MPCIPFCPLFNLQIRIIKCLKVEIHLNSVSQKHTHFRRETEQHTRDARTLETRRTRKRNASAAPIFFIFSPRLGFNMDAVSQTGWKINTNGLQRINRELLFSCCRQSLTSGNFTLSSRCLCQRNVSKNLPAVQRGCFLVQ